MFPPAKPLLILTASALALTACNVTVGGSPPNTTDSAPLAATADQQLLELRANLGNSQITIKKAGQITSQALVMTLPHAILFDTAGTDLRPAIFGDLSALARSLNKFPDSTVDLFSHTDNMGPASLNLRLSTLRAETVRRYLIQKGVAAARLRATGRGETDPVATNLTPEGRLQNQRMEIVIRPGTYTAQGPA